MKKLLLIVSLLGFLQRPTLAQITRLHFYNVVALNYYFIKTAANPNKPIKIKNRVWTILETQKDSVGLLIDNKPYWMPIERGRTYYFMIQSTFAGPAPCVISKTEQEFLLTLHFQNAKAPETYNLDKP